MAQFATQREEKMGWAGTGFLCAESWGWKHVIPRPTDSDSPASSPTIAAAPSALSPSWMETAATWLCMAVAEVIQAAGPTQAKLFSQHVLHHDVGNCPLTKITVVAFLIHTDCLLTNSRVDTTHHSSS